MGRVRTWGFEAVIGIGGKCPERRWKALAGKVNWIGIGPRRTGATDKRGFPVVTFDHFLLFGPDGTHGPSFSELAPRLAERIYSRNVRVLLDDLDEGERTEVERVLAQAKDAPPSSADHVMAHDIRGECKPQSASQVPVKGCSR
jgi:hypothetical protein